MAESGEIEIKEVVKEVVKKVPKVKNVSFEEKGGAEVVEQVTSPGLIDKIKEILEKNKSLIIAAIIVGIAGAYYLFKNKKLLLNKPKEEQKNEVFVMDKEGNPKKTTGNDTLDNEIQLMQQQYKLQFQQLEQKLISQQQEIEQQRNYISRLENANKQQELMQNNRMQQEKLQQERLFQERLQQERMQQEKNMRRNRKEDENVAVHNLSNSELEEITKKLDMLNKQNEE